METNIKAFNIWEQAVQQKNKQQLVGSSQRTLVVLGSPSSGKTSFLKIIKNQSQTDLKPTYVMDYSFLRRGHAKRELTHCYQIAAKTQTDIIPSLVSKQNFSNITMAICIDLSKPGTIIQQVQQWIGIIRKQIGYALNQKVGLQERYDVWFKGKREEVLGHQDFKAITAAPCNIVLVGCKYDLFERYQTQNRKWLSKTLRYLAHINNCHLIFASSRQSILSGQVRSVMQHLMFQDNPKIASQKDHLKPIIVAKGQDTLAAIAVPSSGSVSGLQVLKRQIGGLFTQQEQKVKAGTDISKYSQIKIDTLLQQRKKQLARIAKSSVKKSAF